jgi:hypothetical protein
MALVNEELQRRIGAADATMQSLRVALSLVRKWRTFICSSGC